MFNSINYINVTIWILGSLLIILAIGLIFWRILTRNKTQKLTKNQILKVSNDLKDISHSIHSTYNISSLVNILFKNRFSKNKFSIITMLAFKEKNAFLVANPLTFKKILDISGIDNQILFHCKNKVHTINILQYKEVLRFLKSINLKCQLLIPIEAHINKEINNIHILPIVNLGEYINNNLNQMNNTNTINFAKKINDLNLFKKKSTRKDL